jgi:long-chain acyl-CoA synthetase
MSWTVPDLLAARVAHDPDRVAVETAGTAQLTFAAWSQRSATVAGGLRDRGLTRGQRVGLVFGGRDWVDYAVAYCGVLRAGGVAVPCSDRLAAAEVDYLLEHNGAVGVVGSTGPPGGPARTGRWRATVSELERATGAGEVTVRPEDLAQILYTSGTTGRPKGVAASHANLTHGATVHPRRRRLSHSEHFLHAFPVGTNAGQTMLLNALDARPTAVTVPHFTPVRFARAISGYRVGTVFLVPAMAIELLSSGVLEQHDTGSVVLVGSTAAALPPRVATGLAKAFPNATIVNYYTSTEAAPAYVSMVFDPARPDALGCPAGGKLMVADEHGRPVPVGEPGEVYLRAPFPRRYYRDGAATRAAFRDGWVRMGDIGRLDGEGYLYLVDRDQDVIKSGAWKVSTVQVEAALHEHPAVVEAAVVGVPHPVLGQVVGAAVVSRAAPSLAELRSFLRTRLADHELPVRLVRLDRLPRNPAGKVVKRELVASLARDQKEETT